MNMQFNSGTFSINAEDVRLQPSMMDAIRRNVRSVFRRYPKLLGVKLDLKLDHAKRSYRNHVARVRLILPGHDKVIEKKGLDLGRLIGTTFEVADRQLRKRAREWRARRR